MVKIKKISREKYKGDIYDISVENSESPYFYANGILTHNSLYPHIMIMANLHSRNKENEGWHGGELFNVKGYYNDKEMSGLGKLLRKWYFVRLNYKQKGVLEDGTIFKYKDVDKYIGKKYLIIPHEDGVFDFKTILIDRKEADRLKNVGYDDREYTIKILINLQYGILYHPYYQLVYDAIAGDDCTGLGRQFVKYARKVFRDAGYPIIYTDSVSKDTNVRLIDGREITIEDYWNRYTLNKFDDDKQYADCVEPILTCDDKYKNILKIPKRMIRHKTKKKMYNIKLSNCHNIKVTEDHSLITIDPKTQKLVSVKPEQLKDIKYVLVNNKNIRNIDSKNYSKELYFLMGHVLGNGNLIKQKYSKKYNCMKLSDYYIEDVINKILKPLQTEYGFNISYTNKKTDIVINSTQLSELFYELGFTGIANTKQVPTWLSNESDYNISMFLKGYMSADGGILYRGKTAIVRASSINLNLIKGIDNLFKILGYRTSIFKENKKTKYNNIISKYNMFYLNVKDKQTYMNNIGFIYDVKDNKHTEYKVWFADNSFVKNPSSYIKKNNRVLSNNLKIDIDSDFSLVNIKSIETYYDEDYVYDFSIDKYERFYANDILVHNTDSWYFIDIFNDKKKYLKLKEKVIKDIKDSMPFPQLTFDADIDAEIKYMFFFKGNKSEDKDSDSEMDEDDIINKPKGLMKKNYIYVETDNKLTIKNLGIKKKNISALSKKIFWEHLVPQIKKGQIKFYKTKIENLMIMLLEKDLSLAYMRKSVGPLSQYKKSMTGIQAQISKRYGPGIHFLIPNKRNIGVGKTMKYCSIEEFKSYDMNISDIDFTNFWKELNYFIKKDKVPVLFDFGGENNNE